MLGDEVEIFGFIWEFDLDEIDEYIDQVSVHPGTLVAAGMEDGGADISREGIGLGGGGGLGYPWVGTGCM